MLKRITRDEAKAYHLTGREFDLYVSPESCGAKNVALGVVEFPVGSAPAGHVHPNEEEVILVLAGHGQLVTAEGNAELAPGDAVYIPPGLRHATVSDGTEPLKMVSVYGPPTVPGSYDEEPRS